MSVTAGHTAAGAHKSEAASGFCSSPSRIPVPSRPQWHSYLFLFFLFYNFSEFVFRQYDFRPPVIRGYQDRFPPEPDHQVGEQMFPVMIQSA